MKLGTVVKIRVEITKMMVPTRQNKRTDRQTAPPVKSKSHRIELKIGTGIKTMMGKLEIMTSKYENNGK